MLSGSQVSRTSRFPTSHARANSTRSTLGFKPLDTNEAGVMYESAKGSKFFAYKSAGAGTNKASTAFWTCRFEAEIADLKKRGVVFEEYDTPGSRR